MTDEQPAPPEQDPAETDSSTGTGAPTWVREHSTLLISMIGGLLVAVLSGVFALLGSSIGADGASRAGIAQQQAAADAARADEARKKRADVYGAFLDAAGPYEVAINQLFYSLNRLPKSTSSAPYVPGDAILAAVRDFTSKFRAVHTYGSDAGYEAAKKLKAIFPLDQNLYPVRIVDREAFDQAYDDLMRVMCREASAQPRPGCGH